jgi:phenylalanyl-tRNA synthetase beta chain
VPGLLASADLNRRHIDRFELVEIGSVFATGSAENVEHAQRRHIALVLAAPGRKSQHEDELLRRLKTDLTTFVRQLWNRAVSFTEAAPAAPWEHESRTAGIVIDGQTCGRLTSVPAALRRRIDEHLVATAIVVAELDLTALVALTVDERKLAPVPAHPQIELDFSVLTPAERRYSDIERQLAQYDHPLLRRLAFVDAFEGGSVPVGQRSLTFRAAIGDPTRTLTEADIQDFRSSFLAHLAAGGLTLRG